MEYKQLSREEIEVLTLERVREEKISAITLNDVILSAQRRLLKKAKGDEFTLTTRNVKNLETKGFDLEEDLVLIEEMLVEAKAKVNGN